MHRNPPDLPAAGKSQRPKSITLTQVPAGLVPATIQSNCVPFDTEIHGDGQHALYFLPEASSDLDHYVQYGKKRVANAYEQQFVGIGHGFVDTNGCYQFVITRVIPICSVSRGPTHAKVVSEGNDAMLDVLKNECDIQNRLECRYNVDENGHTIDAFLRYGPSKIVLFGHTHPDLGVSFSPTDHRSNYSTPTTPIVTFVCDPIRKEMKAMVGMKCEDMKVVVCRPKSIVSDQLPQQVVPRAYTVDELWQRISMIANLLLQRSGVNGNFDCHRDCRGRTYMQLRVTYRPRQHASKN